MRKITQEELKVILENHEHWLHRDCDGWDNMKADLNGVDLGHTNLKGANLQGANLCGVNLCCANLQGANLNYVNLEGADLRYTNLNGADLRHTNLRYTNLYGVNLYSANLKYADLRHANLNSADLGNANLYNADLRYANLRCINLKGANLDDADLKDTNLKYTDLRYVDLKGVKNLPYIPPMVCPECGSFIGFKKVKNKIIMLEILNDAKRSSGTSRKCRCNKAKVLEIQELNGDKTDLKEISSEYDNSFIYKVGEIAEASDFDEDRWNECSTGIHFFISCQEAVEYDSM